LHLFTEMLREEDIKWAEEDIVGYPTENPFGGGTPAGDAAPLVAGEDGVVGHLNDRAQDDLGVGVACCYL
jgi:hypothetical protein